MILECYATIDVICRFVGIGDLAWIYAKEVQRIELFSTDFSQAECSYPTVSWLAGKGERVVAIERRSHCRDSQQTTARGEQLRGQAQKVGNPKFQSGAWRSGPSVPRSARSVTPGGTPAFAAIGGSPPVGTLPRNSHVIQTSRPSLPGTATWLLGGVAVHPIWGCRGQLPVPSIVASVGTVSHLTPVSTYTYTSFM